MKKVYLFFAAMVGVALTSCSGDELTDTSPTPIVETESPIMFGSLSKGFTRGDFQGADAATRLGNQFVVSGYKGPKSLWDDTKNKLVFDNYVVKYKENTAHTTASNVANWEYVGQERIKHAKDKGITSQTIKYWDYSQPQYDFIAWSTGSKTAIYEGTPVAGQVLVSAITPGTATGTGDGKVAYTFTGTSDDLSECYIADLVTVKKSNSNYKDPVTLTFRQLGTKVRIGIYETIPGYSVRNVKFYTQGGILTNKATEIVENATIFSTGADIYKEGTYTITFPTVDNTSDANNNQAHVSFAPKTGAAQATIVDWDGLNYTIAEEGEQTPGSVYLGRSSNTASFAGDAATNYYVTYLPNETGANLNLRVDFTLESIDGGGEIIEVKNAKAQVPSIYTTWKPGFAYTYLFKISDKTNGRTGVYDPTQADDATFNSDPAGLYPITFDAVVVNAEDNDQTQETITTVMTPSITTYQKESTVVNADEYTANGKDIFVTVNEGDAIVDIKGKAAVYIIPTGKTEADVVDALQMQDDNYASGTIKGRSGLVLDGNGITSSFTNTVQYGANGNAINIELTAAEATAGAMKAFRFTPASNKTYAFVYTKTAADPTNDVEKYQALNWSNFKTGQTKYRYKYIAPTNTYYNVDDKGTVETTDDVTTEYFDAQKGVKYFSETGGVYTMIAKPFIGQGVGNLYLDDEGNTIASGYAKSQLKYYYTTDNGMSYQEAHNVNYADFNNTLFVKGTTPGTYVANTDATPQDGTAYYYYDTVNDKYVYCVILPQQTKTLYVLDTNTYVVADETDEVVGQTYFDKYVKNDGEYYAKIIKVQ